MKTNAKIFDTKYKKGILSIAHCVNSEGELGIQILLEVSGVNLAGTFTTETAQKIAEYLNNLALEIEEMENARPK